MIKWLDEPWMEGVPYLQQRFCVILPNLGINITTVLLATSIFENQDPWSVVIFGFDDVANL